MKVLRLEKRTLSRLRRACLAALVFAAFLASCTQDPILSMIAREVKPREPLIKGVPSKMAVFTEPSPALYVGSTALYRYAMPAGTTTGAWSTDIPQPPGGGILDLAATRKYLYVLTGADSPALYRWDGNVASRWDNIPFSNNDFPRLQAIHGETDDKGIAQGDYLFVGAGKRSVNQNDTEDYAVFCIDDSPSSAPPTWTTVKTGTALLTGAARDGANHYFSTGGDGIYSWGGSGTAVQITGDKNVKGMIQISSPAVTLAFTYGGEILKVSPSGTTTLNSNSLLYIGGRATVWRQAAGSSPDILLVTVIAPDSTYGPTYGYREINLSSGPVNSSTPGEISLREPGNPSTGFPSTMDDNNRFRDTIAAKPVNSIFQVPFEIDNEMPLFASIQGTGTMKHDTDGGLWSYRIRDGVFQWNAE